MSTLWTVTGIILLLIWLGVCVWSWVTPSPKTTETSDPERDRQIGFLTNALGGGIEEGFQVRYIISRLEEDLGRRATFHEMATAVGVKVESDV